MRQNAELPRRLLVAVGGNAIHPKEICGTPEELVAVAAKTSKALLPIVTLDSELVITHGNGPGVGMTLMRQALSRHRVPPMSMDICVAHSQGGIGYLLVQALRNELDGAKATREVACLLTQVEVDPDDPAFLEPSKPVGLFYNQAEARDLERELGWAMREDAGRGWRHVVPSPEPKCVVELPLIRRVAAQGVVVVAAGGGGIPIAVDSTGRRRGVNAVVDKDLTSAYLANHLGADELLILTAVSRISINYGFPQQKELDVVCVADLRAYLGEGHFPVGSMGPKVQAALRFVEAGGKRAIIGHLDEAAAALRGEAGTHIVPCS